MDKLKDGLASVAILGLVFGVPIGLGALGSSNSSPSSDVAGVTDEAVEPICITESIPYLEIEEETDELDLGETEVDTYGEEGEREICTIDGVEVSNEVTEEPVTEVTFIGTYEEPEPYVAPRGYGGYNDVGCPKNQYVSGYTRANGTYVSGYYRNSPNDDCY